MANSLLEGDSKSPVKAPSTRYELPPAYEAPPEVAEPEEEPVNAPNFHDDLLSAIEKSIENVRGSSPLPRERISAATVSRSQERTADEPASPGIRDLVSRIENAVGPEFLDGFSQSDDEPEEDDLSRDLREIEALRGELNGLRERISSGR